MQQGAHIVKGGTGHVSGGRVQGQGRDVRLPEGGEQAPGCGIIQRAQVDSAGVQIVRRDVSRTRRGGVSGLAVIVGLGRRLVAEQRLGKGQAQAGEVRYWIGVLDGLEIEPGLEIPQVKGSSQDADATRVPAALIKGAQPFVGIILADACQQTDAAVPDSQPGGGIQQITSRHVNQGTARRGQQIVAP